MRSNGIRPERRWVMILGSLLAVMLTFCSCGDAWQWLWSPGDEETVGTDDLIVNGLTNNITGTDAQTDTEAIAGTDTKNDTETETSLIANAAVPYTGEAHEGTGIVYYTPDSIHSDRVIAIDPGHQLHGNSEKEPVGPGADVTQGKVSGGTQGVSTKNPEYQLNLDVALLLRDELIRRGYTVVMIRETNEVDISNAERAVIANQYEADAFVRIHANGWDDENKRGALMVCHSAKNPYPDCAAVYPQSRQLSDTILNAYCKATGLSRLSVWETDTKAGTNWSRVPTTILEMGFMTNPEEDELMATEAFQKAAAQGVADGLDDYFDLKQGLVENGE